MALNGYVLHVDLSDIRELVALQRRCANNLNQVAVHANTYGIYPSEITALQKDYAGNCEQAESGKHPSASIFQDTVLENQYNRVHPIQRAICWGFIMAENLSDQRTAPSSQKE